MRMPGEKGGERALPLLVRGRGQKRRTPGVTPLVIINSKLYRAFNFDRDSFFKILKANEKLKRWT